jgi:hypothetical protein
MAIHFTLDDDFKKLDWGCGGRTKDHPHQRRGYDCRCVDHGNCTGKYRLSNPPNDRPGARDSGQTGAGLIIAPKEAVSVGGPNGKPRLAWGRAGVAPSGLVLWGEHAHTERRGETITC